jgi:predicted membrane-bound mannosyltransferase
MNEIQTGEHDFLRFVRQDTLIGALVYLAIFVVLALVLSRLLRTAMHAAMALKVAGDKVDARAVVGCFLTKIDAASVNLELRVRAKDSADRDTLRATLLAELARRFAEARIGGGGSEAATYT